MGREEVDLLSGTKISGQLRNKTALVTPHKFLQKSHENLKFLLLGSKGRVLDNSKFGVLYSNFLSLTPIFCKASIEEYRKTLNFFWKTAVLLLFPKS